MGKVIVVTSGKGGVGRPRPRHAGRRFLAPERREGRGRRFRRRPAQSTSSWARNGVSSEPRQRHQGEAKLTQA